MAKLQVPDIPSSLDDGDGNRPRYMGWHPCACLMAPSERAYEAAKAHDPPLVLDLCRRKMPSTKFKIGCPRGLWTPPSTCTYPQRSADHAHWRRNPLSNVAMRQIWTFICLYPALAPYVPGMPSPVSIRTVERDHLREKLKTFMPASEWKQGTP